MRYELIFLQLNQCKTSTDIGFSELDRYALTINNMMLFRNYLQPIASKGQFYKYFEKTRCY